MLYVRRDSDDVLELLTMLVENVSSDSEAEDLDRDATLSVCIWFYKRERRKIGNRKV